MNGSGETDPESLPLRLLDSAPVAVSVWQGRRHELAYMNNAYRVIFGDQPHGLPAHEAFGDLPRKEYLELFDHVYETGESVHRAQTPVRVHQRYGEPERRYFSISMSPVPTLSGGAVDRGRGVLVVVVEVTGQVTASEQVRLLSEKRRRALHRYESLVAAGAQMVWVTDPAGRIVERSPAWEQVTGMSWEEIRNEGWLNSAHPDDRGPLAESWSRAVQEVPELFEYSFRLRQRDGSYRHCEIRAVPVRESGVVVEWVGACVDIEARWQQERRMTLLARASAAVTGSVRVEEAFAALSRVVVPDLADKCGIYLFPETAEPPEDSPLVINRIAVVARDGLPQNLPPLQEERIDPHSAFGRAVRERQPVHAAFPPSAVPSGIVPPGTLAWATRAGAHSMVLVPILVDGVVVAVADTFVCGNRPPVGSDEMQLVRELLEQAHDPLSRALELRRTRRVAMALQECLLTAPPRITNMEIVARYTSSPAADEVGGDWYDSFLLPDGSLTLIIGDIAGHDVDAAVTMSQLRNMLRGLAVDRLDPPGEVLRRLDRCTATLSPDEATATCVFARVESVHEGPGGHHGRWFHYSTAGHPPPLLVTPEGNARYLTGAHNPIIGGLTPDESRSSATEPLPAGSTLLLYTDGLIERRHEHLDQGLERLRQQAAALVREPLAAFCDRLLAQSDSASDDDIALIALRLPAG